MGTCTIGHPDKIVCTGHALHGVLHGSLRDALLEKVDKPYMAVWTLDATCYNMYIVRALCLSQDGLWLCLLQLIQSCDPCFRIGLSLSKTNLLCELLRVLVLAPCILDLAFHFIELSKIVGRDSTPDVTFFVLIGDRGRSLKRFVCPLACLVHECGSRRRRCVGEGRRRRRGQ